MTALDTVVCRWGTDPDDVRAPERLEDDQVVLAALPPVPLRRAMRWHDPPVDHPSWQLGLHSLRWTYRHVLLGARGDRAACRLVDAVYTSWWSAHPTPGSSAVEQAWGGHAVALRTQVATAAAHLLGLESAHRLLDVGIAWLQDEANFDGDWNHGVDQSIGLLLAAHVRGDAEARSVAVGRLERHRAVAIDDQGVVNEQAPEYQSYVRTQYGHVADALEACGFDGSAFRRARSSMRQPLVHATRPDGTLAPIGDTLPGRPGRRRAALSEGSCDQKPDTVAIYAGGYAFGRDRWGEDGTWFALRFGPGRRIHGHRDHASLLYDVLGVPVLTEAGFSGYRPGPWRKWEQSHHAHNVLSVSDGGRFLWDHETTLDHQHVTDDHVSLTVTGRPTRATKFHRRAVAVCFRPHAIVILDRLVARRTVQTQQLWHLPAGWRVASPTPSLTVGTGPTGRGLRIHQLRASPTPEVIAGRQDPIQGFVATGRDARTAAPVVAYHDEGTQVEYLTALLPTAPTLPQVEVDLRDEHTLTLTGGDQRVEVQHRDGNLRVRNDRQSAT